MNFTTLERAVLRKYTIKNFLLAGYALVIVVVVTLLWADPNTENPMPLWGSIGITVLALLAIVLFAGAAAYGCYSIGVIYGSRGLDMEEVEDFRGDVMRRRLKLEEKLR